MCRVGQRGAKGTVLLRRIFDMPCPYWCVPRNFVELLAAIEGGVADVAAGDEVDYIFGDIGGVVSDAFEVFCDENELEGCEDDGGIFHHVGEQFAEKLIAKAIDLIVTLQHAAGEIDIAANKRVQAIANHSFGELAHPRKVDIRLHLRMPENAHGRLRDVDGLVANAFEIAIDARDSQEKSKVGGHGLLQCEKALDAFVDFDLHFVDGVFFAEHNFSEVLFGIEHGVDGLVHSTLGEASHPEQALFQFFEIAFEMAFHVVSVPLDRTTQFRGPSSV
jgi:hypothetical protein